MLVCRRGGEVCDEVGWLREEDCSGAVEHSADGSGVGNSGSMGVGTVHGDHAETAQQA